MVGITEMLMFRSLEVGFHRAETQTPREAGAGIPERGRVTPALQVLKRCNHIPLLPSGAGVQKQELPGVMLTGAARSGEDGGPPCSCLSASL